MASPNYKTLPFLILILLCELLPSYARPSLYTTNSTLYNRSVLVKRKPTYPSETDVEAAINSGMPPPDLAMFYTGLGEDWGKAGDYAQDKGLTHINDKTNYIIWKPPCFFDGSRYDGDERQQREFFDNVSRTYASRASGTAYLYTPGSRDPDPTGIFYRVEYPAMRDGGLVTKIIRLDSENPPSDPTSVKDVWWETGGEDPSSQTASAASDHAYCGLGMYADAYHCPLNDGIGYLASKGESTKCADANECNRVSCSYGTGILLCNDNDDEYCISGAALSDEVFELQTSCDPYWNIPNYDGDYYEYTDCSSATTMAMQQFFNDGHNILVSGGYDC